MKSRKGGYKLVSLQLVELTTMESLTGLYGAIVNSHDKPLLISDIVIDGERKNNVYCRAEKGTNKYTIKNVYGYDIEVTNADAVEVTENADGIELPKPTPEDDGSIVGVNVQGKYVLKPNPLGESTQADNGKVLEVINGEWSIGGKKVNVIDSPNTSGVDVEITQEQKAKILEGVFINGIFLGYKNPILTPAFYEYNGVFRGFILSGNPSSGLFVIGTYLIAINNHISVANTPLSINPSNGKVILLGKYLPDYPADSGTFTLKCVDGTLTWVQDQ